MHQKSNHDKENYIIRPALNSEANELTKLAFLSKAHWGYPKEWLEAWREELTVTPEMLTKSITFVAELNGDIVGFWCRSTVKSQSSTPGLLFIHPKHMGKGLGKKLFESIKSDAVRRGIDYFTIEADPNALLFYLKMGAVQIGEQESKVIPGRKIPILRFYLK